MKKSQTIILVTLVSLFLCSGVTAAQEVVGKIVAVNEAQETILLKNKKQQINEYRLSFDTDIKLNKKDVELTALKPIDYKSFCEARVELNQDHEVVAINAAYRAVEVVVTGVENNNLVVKKINTGLTRKFALTDKVKMMRNNVLVNAKEIGAGDKGLVVLGLNNQLQKLIVFNYQVYGILKKSNAATREIVLNVGTRLNPCYQTFNLPTQVKIKYNQKLIDFNQLSSDMWVKVEIDGSVREIVVRKI